MEKEDEDSGRRTMNAYQEGLEESIRRCEELLAFTPLTFLPTRRASFPKAQKPADVMPSPDKPEDINLGDLGVPDAEWNKNMELLSRITEIDPITEEKQAQESDHDAPEDERLPSYHKTVSDLRNLNKELVTKAFDLKASNLKSGYAPDTEWSRTSDDFTLGSLTQVLSPSTAISQDCMLSSDTVEDDFKDSNRRESAILSSNNGLLEVTMGQDVVTIDLGDPGTDTRRNLRETVSVSYSCPESEDKSDVAQRVRSSQEDMPRSTSGDDVEIVIESTSKGQGARTQDEAQSSQLKFCPLEDKPPRKHQRSKSAPKEFRDTREFYNAITEVMDNLKSYIHLPSLAPDNNATGKDRLNNLSKPKTEIYKRLAEVKQIIEAKQLRECSFKPAVGRRPDLNWGNSVPVLERLTEMQQQKEIRKRQARRIIEKEELDACSFRPKINNSSPYYDRNLYQPLPERFKELERRRRETIEKAMKEQDLGYTFKPEINPKSVQLFKQKGLETVDLADRLTTVGHSVHLDCKNEIEGRKATFSPEINSNTDDIIACSKQFGGHVADFFSRQQHYLRMLEEKRKQKENEIPLDLTFTPNIGNSEYILKQSIVREMFPETPDERVERLAYKDKANQMQIRKKVADEYYAQFNFQPEIDEVSRLVGRSSSTRDLYANPKGQEVRKELEDAAEEDFQQKCPFRPVITTSIQDGQKIQFRSSFIERLQARKETFPGYIQESRTMKELEEIKECTFKPAVNHTRPREVSPVVIRGLNRHLELQQIAKQMKKDQENLEKKVFFSHVSSLPIRQYTIPKPFSFTENSKFETRAASSEDDEI